MSEAPLHERWGPQHSQISPEEGKDIAEEQEGDKPAKDEQDDGWNDFRMTTPLGLHTIPQSLADEAHFVAIVLHVVNLYP